MRLLPFLLALFVALPAAADIPKKWHAAMQEKMPRDQKIVQTFAADVDNDGEDEWIAIGEPTRVNADAVSIGIFTPAKAKAPAKGEAKAKAETGPELRFAQLFQGEGLRRAGAVARSIKPVGNAVVLVGASPRPNGNSLFMVQIYAWNGERFRPALPEGLDFRSQGGFAIEDVVKHSENDEVVAWSFVHGANEQLFDQHRYDTKIYHWDGIRFLAPEAPTRTDAKLASPDEAAKTLGVTTGDLRRQIPGIAEVP